VGKIQRVYDTPDAATEGAAELAVQAAQQVYTHYVPAAAEGVVDLEGLSVTQQQQQQHQHQQQELQSQALQSSGSGGAQLSEADNMLWRLLLLARLEAAGRQAIGQVAPLAASGQLQQDLKVRSSYSTAKWLSPQVFESAKR
jgi:hypothetical protein